MGEEDSQVVRPPDLQAHESSLLNEKRANFKKQIEALIKINMLDEDNAALETFVDAIVKKRVGEKKLISCLHASTQTEEQKEVANDQVQKQALLDHLDLL